MWFPETSRTLAAMGAEVILHLSMTSTIDRELELTLARATSITNQCYMFDINGVGYGGYGRSIVCGPEGAVLYQAGNGEEIIPIEVDLERVRHSREHNTQYEKAFGTLYTAAYYPTTLAAEFHWPSRAILTQAFADFKEQKLTINLRLIRISFKKSTVS